MVYKIFTFIFISQFFTMTGKADNNPEIHALITELINEGHLIPAERKESLNELAENVELNIREYGLASLNFICTHNSRRSQLAELWFRTGVGYFGLEHISSFSGGTESTAFNHRMVAAIARAGFSVETVAEGENPKYIVRTNPQEMNYALMFSKKYNESYNPQKNYIAVMVCSQADEGCPVVFGASARVAIPYEDPKNYDDSPEESAAYDAKIKEIGREMLYVLKMINNKNR
jgi:arsenate reductase (thioredoxin)